MVLINAIMYEGSYDVVSFKLSATCL